MPNRLQSRGHVRDIDPDALTVTAILSTGNLARDGMIIEQAGWDFTEFRRNPVVLWGHDDSSLPVARVKDLMSSERETTAVIEFDPEDERAEALFSKVRRGFVNTMSVRWNPRKWESRKLDVDGEEREVVAFTDQELLEASFVSIPSDPGATVLRADGSRLNLADFKDPEPAPEPDTSAAEIERLHARQLMAVIDTASGVIESRSTRPGRIRAAVITAIAERLGKTPEQITEDLFR